MESECMSTNSIQSQVHEKNASEDGCTQAEQMFIKFDKDRDEVLNPEEFSAFLQYIFYTDSLTADAELTKQFMSLLDLNHDGVIDRPEFHHAFSHCFNKVLHPVSALIIVDVQYDFIDGSLALRNCPAKQEGSEVVPVINNLLKDGRFDMVVYSLDWHPQTHISFVENITNYPLHHSCKKTSTECRIYDEVMFDLSPPRTQVLWPSHCVQHSEGAKLARDLTVVPDAVNIYKGTNTDIDSYSAFFDNMRLSQTSMQRELQQKNVTDVYVCGLAYDVCVAATSKDAMDLGYRTVVIDDACRGVDSENIRAAKLELEELGALVLNSNEVVELVNGEVNPRVELGLFAAKTMPRTLST